MEVDSKKDTVSRHKQDRRRRGRGHGQGVSESRRRGGGVTLLWWQDKVTHLSLFPVSLTLSL